jgi:hypothetical protein
LTSSKVSNNGSSNGGGIYSLGTATILDSTLSNNTADGSHGGAGGGLLIAGTLTMTNTTVRANLADNGYYGAAGGAGLLLSGTAEIIDCRIKDNQMESNFWPGQGGGVSTGTGSDVTLRGCLIKNNSGVGPGGEVVSGGGVASRGTLLMADCAVVDNTADTGGGVFIQDLSTATLKRCTMAGNVADGGGGLWAGSGASVQIGGCLLAENTALVSADDCSGTLVTQGYNLIENTLGCTLSGPTNLDLLGVTPLLVDPSNGDYRLQVNSPAVEGGNPAAQPEDCSTSVLGDARLLDGDLDGNRIRDIGAYEFSHVEVDIQGTAQPGNSLTLDFSGTAGLFVFLAAGLPGELPFGSVGCLFLDVTLPKMFVALGLSPIPSLVGQVATNIPVGTEFVVQTVGLTGSGSGNVSNPVRLVVE